MVGIPTYGRTFELADENQFDIGAPAKKGGTPGKYTQEQGFLSYYEVWNCLLFGMSVFEYFYVVKIKK